MLTPEQHLELAESVGLIGPGSRVGDTHNAVLRFAQALTQALATTERKGDPISPTSGNILVDAFNEVQALKQQATTEPVQAVDERAAFEDWAKARSLPLDGHGGHYSNIRTRNNWLGWQARASQHATTEPDEDDGKWRDVALRFDKHRMQALWHLQAMLKDPEKHADIVRQFLKDPTHPAAATTERKGEPVGEVIWDKRFGCTAGQLFEPLPVGTKLYTSPQVPEDTARLDWLQSQSLDDFAIGFVVDGDHDGEYWCSPESGGMYYGATLREAIDAARKGAA